MIHISDGVGFKKAFKAFFDDFGVYLHQEGWLRMEDGQEDELEPHLRAHAHGVDDPGHGAVGLVGAAVGEDFSDCGNIAVGVVHCVDNAYVQHSGKKMMVRYLSVDGVMP